MEKTEGWALLWSKKGNCFHVEPLERAAKSGSRFFDENMTNDYLLISSGDHDQVSAKADELRPILEERDEVRKLYQAGGE